MIVRLPDGPGVAGGLFAIDQAHLAGYGIADALVGDRLGAARRAFEASEERRRLRTELLARLGASEVFAAGAVLVFDAEGRPDPHGVYVAVTDRELVLLDGDVESAPEREIGRLSMTDITGIRLLDGQGELVDVSTIDEVSELDDPGGTLVALWVDRADGGSNGFVFHAPTLALEAKRDFERVLARRRGVSE